MNSLLLKNIKQFPQTYYKCDVSLDFITDHLTRWNRGEENLLIMNPEWQRGHVWNRNQKIKYLEYLLKGGTTGREVYFNCSSWGTTYDTPVYCLDGLQRLTAIQDFWANRVPVFGHLLQEYSDPQRLRSNTIKFNMLNIKNKKELLGIYLDFNSAGTIHSPKELKRIEKMIEDTDPKEIL